jgi:(1->4)-alpha-D-glucan 1-alpha-D-glucosylmutase
VHTTKRSVADGILHSEVLRLVREGVHDTDQDPAALADAVGELLTDFPVYRSYLPRGEEHLDQAAAEATRRRPDLTEPIAAVVGLLKRVGSPISQRFQQTSGMVMAKGVEDNAFYRYTRLTSLTEVGGEPNDFSETVERFHRRMAGRQERWAAAMTTLSTHDTKRGEDVRARIDVLAEVPDEWASIVDELERVAPFGDPTFANLLWQAAVGAWPIERERLHAYAEKASREAGVSTTWTAPDEAFEQRMHAAVDAVYDDQRVGAVIRRAVERVQSAGWSNSLAMKLLQLTAPGVPDVYQGSELWETSLVDPDNRRPVDYALRRRLLAEIDAGALPILDETGAAKLLLVAHTLRTKRERPDLFTGYTPLHATGPAAEHVVAFDRGGAMTVATRLPIGLAGRGGWGDTAIDLGSSPVRDVLTGVEHQSGELRLADALATYPVALFIPVGGKP